MAEVSRRQRRTVLSVIVVAELVIALITGAGVAFAYHRVNSKIEPGAPIPHPPGVERADPKTSTSSLNLLVLGTDTRDCDGCGIDKQGGLGGSDMTLLIHVEKGRRSAYGISIPRDTLVDRPACTTEDGSEVPAATDVMWNEALAVGGPACTAAQVQSVTGVYVDDYIVVDFAGFKEMVDAIDGVEVCIPAAIDDDKHNIHLDAGTQVVKGDAALAYVRQRSSTPNSDLGRMKRQQAFIASMLAKLTSTHVLTDWTSAYDFAKALAGSITTSPDLASVSALGKLGWSLRDANLDEIKFVTAPVADFPEGDPNWGRLQLTADAEAYWQKVIDDEPLGSLAKGAVSPRRQSGSKQTAAENGLCT